MIEKIKQSLLYIIAPVLAVLGFIAYLLSRISELNSQLGRVKAEKDIVKTLQKKEDAIHEAEIATKQASDAESDYNAIRDQYERESGTKSDPKP